MNYNQSNPTTKIPSQINPQSNHTHQNRLCRVRNFCWCGIVRVGLILWFRMIKMKNYVIKLCDKIIKRIETLIQLRVSMYYIVFSMLTLPLSMEDNIFQMFYFH